MRRPEDPFIQAFPALVFLLSLLLFPAGTAGPSWALTETHLDRGKLPAGCSACHRGHGTRGTPMLAAGRLKLCFTCHGSSAAGGIGKRNTDVESAFAKRSRHPVFTTLQYHEPREILPERKPTQPRHVACDDCHEVHFITSRDPFGYVTGFSSDRVPLKRAVNEYEVCYKCHSESANLPGNQKDKRLQFQPENPSMHPVEAVGRNTNVPSLIPPLTYGSIIRCGSCHGNDDPAGARGPHGSIYEPILVANYTTTDGPESPLSYELCYRCHNRDSILADDSFKAHRTHVQFEETACFTCHTSHGSRRYTKLIEFNEAVVQPDSSGRLLFIDGFGGKPDCFLACHGVEHNEAFYQQRNW